MATPKGRSALARICEDYRRPVLVVLLARGFSEDEVEDLTQDFFPPALRDGGVEAGGPAARSLPLVPVGHADAHSSARVEG